MKKIIILAICIWTTTTYAYFDHTNGLATEAGVWWGDDLLAGNNVTGITEASYASGYTNMAEFVAAAAATANYNTALVSINFHQSRGLVLDYTQQIIRAKAQFTDTFVVCGPIGTGTVVYSEAERDALQTVTIHLEDEPTNIVNPEVTVTRRILHDGQETDIKSITFGKPFTVTCEIEGSITLNGTNYNNMISVLRESSYSLLGFTVYDGNGEGLSNGFSIVSSSGAIFSQGPPVFIDRVGSNIAISWHSVTNGRYSVALAPSLSDASWSQMVAGVIGNGHTNAVDLVVTNDHPLFIRLEME